MPRDDTIFALASAPGRSGVAVIRISGPQSEAALQSLTDGQPLPKPREAVLRRLRRNVSRETIDEALVLRFSEGASFTGETTVEFHCHGSPAVIAAVFDELSRMKDLRLAEPGEFTRRAFEAGRLDLAQIEGLSDLVAADTDAQRRAALRAYDGELGAMCRGWSADLTRALALLEATIDFADEEIPADTYDHVRTGARGVYDALSDALSGAQLVERLRVGWRIAIVGAPNAGKSSLINALASRDIAITSPIAGTTRDSIEVALDLDGYPVTLIDTAGLRETKDAIEREGVSRAQKMAATADLRILLIAPDAPLDPSIDRIAQPGDLRVWNKSDLGDPDAETPYEALISATSVTGLATLLEALRTRLAIQPPSQDGLLLRQRHDAALRDAVRHLDGFFAYDMETVVDTPELACEDLRMARAALGRITGETGVEALLDVIFSEFCLGK